MLIFEGGWVPLEVENVYSANTFVAPYRIDRKYGTYGSLAMSLKNS